MVQKTLAKLRKDHSFKLLPALGADLKAATEWALKYQNELCGKGSGQINRKGFLFDQGHCIKTDSEQANAQKILSYLTQALSGQGIVEVNEKNEKTGVQSSFRFKAFAWAKTPIADLRSVLPKKLDECGHAREWRDKTMSGLLPTQMPTKS